jgi:hypothetical protein
VVRRLNGLTFGLSGRGTWDESAACSSVCGLRAQPKIFVERNILGEEYLHVKFNLKIEKMCEIFPKLNMTLDMLCIVIKKLLWSNSNLNFSNVPNLVTLVQIL